jgi:DNA-binding response OmpR family regulator
LKAAILIQGREAAMQTARILIVDDDSNIRTSVRMCLETAGYIVEQATHGADALEFIHRVTPDLILLDLAMPVMDGMTVLAEIRTLLPKGSPRIVVMTAHGSVKTAIQAVRLGASDFLEKPFTPDELRQSVASVLHAEYLPNLLAPGSGYGEVLQRVRAALRAGEFREAEKDLMAAGLITDDDPAFLNLAGVLHESHGRIESASRFYQKAAAKNRSYLPAQENLKRLGEIRRHGKSNRSVAFGDERVVATGNWKSNT